MSKLVTTRFLFILILLVAAVACQQKPREYHDSFLAFGTLIEVTLYDVDEQKAQQAFRHIRDDLAVMHRIWHVWEPGSLYRMNQLLEYTGEFSAAPSVLEVVKVAKVLARQSKQLFNPAIGKLIALWGFHSNKQPGILPADAEIRKLVKMNPTLEDITIKGVRMSNTNPAVKIDLGGIAKGYAIDRLLVYLKQQGINNAIINTGGDLKVIGRHGDRPWKVAIRDPRKKDAIVATLELNDGEAVFTSGDYERYFKSKKNGDQHYHHIIDPRTGYPAQGSQSVTVLHTNGSTADAAATALFVAGPKQWVEIARSMGIKYVLLIDDKGKLHISRAMKKRLKFEEQRDIVEVIDL